MMANTRDLRPILDHGAREIVAVARAGVNDLNLAMGVVQPSSDDWLASTKLEAAERLPEVRDELVRRGVFDEVSLISTEDKGPPGAQWEPQSRPLRIEAQIWISPPAGPLRHARHYMSVRVLPNGCREGKGSSNWRPFVLQVEMNTEEKYAILIRGRELTFEALLLAIDDFLAGVTAGRVLSRS